MTIVTALSSTAVPTGPVLYASFSRRLARRVWLSCEWFFQLGGKR